MLFEEAHLLNGTLLLCLSQNCVQLSKTLTRHVAWPSTWKNEIRIHESTLGDKGDRTTKTTIMLSFNITWEKDASSQATSRDLLFLHMGITSPLLDDWQNWKISLSTGLYLYTKDARLLENCKVPLSLIVYPACAPVSDHVNTFSWGDSIVTLTLIS